MKEQESLESRRRMNSSPAHLSSRTAEDADQNRAIYLYATLPTLAAITTLMAGIRFYSRIVLQQGRLRLDDYLIGASLVCILVNTAMQVHAATWGVGRHMDALTPTEQTNAKFFYYISSFFAVSGLGIPKMAVVCLICRIFDPRLWLRCLLWFGAVMCTVQFFFATATFLMQCRPYYALWDVTVTDEVCVDLKPIQYYRYYGTCKCHPFLFAQHKVSL